MASHSFQASLLTRFGVLGACAAIAMPASHIAMFNAALPEQIREILTTTHTEVQSYRADIVSDRVAMLANRSQAGEDIRAVVASVRSGESDPFTGQIRAITHTTLADNNTERQAITATHRDIWEARKAAGGDIRVVFADTFDGSTVEAVGEILDTAHADIAADRSLIATDAKENTVTRGTTAVAAHEIVRSAASGEIDRVEASAELNALVTNSHTQIEANHVEMVSAHVDIKSTKKTAATDVHNTVKDSRNSVNDSGTGSSAKPAAKK
ncbi:hypothetical protein BH09ACT8_BH09ACT8_14880 [soil metagenome]